TRFSRDWSSDVCSSDLDPIVTASQMVMALQTVVSRQVDITAHPAVVSFGAVKGGIRHNIIPDRVELLGTIRTFDQAQRERIFTKIGRASCRESVSIREV